MAGDDEGDEPTPREIALARAAQELLATLDSLPHRFPEAFGGRYGGPTNDDMTIAVVEGAPGADELVATVQQAEQRSLEQVGVSFRFRFEPTDRSHSALDAVRRELSEELVAQGPLFALGLRGAGLGRSCVAVHAEPGSGPAVEVAVRHRFPGVPIEVSEVRVWLASKGPLGSG